jgi:hypothetical protein
MPPKSGQPPPRWTLIGIDRDRLSMLVEQQADRVKLRH